MSVDPAPHTRLRTNIVKVVAASLVGTTIEWYDFFLYGSAAALVFPRCSSPASDPARRHAASPSAPSPSGSSPARSAASSSATSATRSAARSCWSFSLLLMGVATFAIGLLPTYATIGSARRSLLVVLRLIQGFALGGEWGGAVLIVTEHGDRRAPRFLGVLAAGRRRRSASCWPPGCCALLAAVQTDEAFRRVGLADPVPAVGGAGADRALDPARRSRSRRCSWRPRPRRPSGAAAGREGLDADPRGVPALPARGVHRDGRPVRRERLVLHLHHRHLHLRHAAARHCRAGSCWTRC